jgi:hypothetical protein
MIATKAILFLLVNSIFADGATAGAPSKKRSTSMQLDVEADKNVGLEVNAKEHDAKEHEANPNEVFGKSLFAEYAHMSDDEFEKMAEEETRDIRYALYSIIEEQENRMKEAAEKDPMVKFYQGLYGNQGLDHPDYLAYKSSKNKTTSPVALSDIHDMLGLTPLLGMLEKNKEQVADEGEQDELPSNDHKVLEAAAKKVAPVLKKQPVADMLNFDSRQASVDALGNIRHIRTE